VPDFIDAFRPKGFSKSTLWYNDCLILNEAIPKSTCIRGWPNLNGIGIQAGRHIAVSAEISNCGAETIEAPLPLAGY
jgi:hypothetical protein